MNTSNMIQRTSVPYVVHVSEKGVEQSTMEVWNDN